MPYCHSHLTSIVFSQSIHPTTVEFRGRVSQTMSLSRTNKLSSLGGLAIQESLQVQKCDPRRFPRDALHLAEQDRCCGSPWPHESATNLVPHGPRRNSLVLQSPVWATINSRIQSNQLHLTYPRALQPPVGEVSLRRGAGSCTAGVAGNHCLDLEPRIMEIKRPGMWLY